LITVFKKFPSAQPKIKKGFPSCTNCIATLLWADGDNNRTKPILFTHDSRFRTDNVKTPRRRSIYNHQKRFLEENGLSADQIVVLPGKRYYVPESPDIVRKYLSHFQLDPRCVIFTDKGKAFFDKGKSVVSEFGISSFLTPQLFTNTYLQMKITIMGLQK